MSNAAAAPSVTSIAYEPRPTAAAPARSFVGHAKLIGFYTLLSRIMGLGREVVAGHYLGTGLVASAFAVAFTIPNLFRKLFGEGALSAAFIPLYAQSLKNDDDGAARHFAAATVNLLIVVLSVLTVLSEIILWIIAHFFDLQPDRLRTLLGSRFWDMKTPAGQTEAVYFLSLFVLAAGVAQILMLLPSLRAIGFRFEFTKTFWTPAVKKMVTLSLPVAIGAGVLQISVLLDRGISFFLARSINKENEIVSGFHLLGKWISYPMELGAAARLNWAQYLYQFPLGVFAIALATAIFPTLSADAIENKDKFAAGLRRGIRVTLWEGLPASLGLLLVARPAVQLLFERGNFTPADTIWVTRSVQMYALGIWAFSLNQILSRAFYAMHDTKTPLLMAVLTLVINLIVELPLLWTRLGESAMAVGTTVSFIVQVLL